MPPPPVPFAIRIVFTDAAQREATSLLNDGRFTQRLGLIESRQARLERDLKQVEMQMNGFVEQLAHRPLKTDVISAIAQQELAVEACASREALEKLEAVVRTCAPAASVSSLEETTRASAEKVGPSR